MKSNINQVAVAYLGKTGGGVSFFESVYLDLSKFGNVLGLLASDSEVRLPSSSRLIQVRAPHKIWELFFDLRWIISSVLVTIKIFRLGISDVIFLMPQPIDYVFSIFLRICKIRVSYVIHDPSHHSGEIWPFRKSMKARIRIAYRVFFLSSYVADQFNSLNLHKKFVVTILEARQNESKVSLNNTNQYGKYFLHVGRMKSYKGLERMLMAWDEIDYLDTCLLIAGAGIRKSLMGRCLPNNTILIDRWLTEGEIWSLVENSNGLILLYEEATQSGIAAIALNLGIPILSTNVGGLKEQLQVTSNSLVVENNYESIKHGLSEFGKLKRIFRSNLEMHSQMQVSLKIFEEFCTNE